MRFKKFTYIVIKFSRIAVLMSLAITVYFTGPKSVMGSDREFLRFVDLTGLDSLEIFHEKIRPGETLSNILLPYDVSYKVINRLERLAKPTFDIRKFRSGNNYFIINESNPINKIRYFIYEQNLIDYVVFKLDDPVDVYKGIKMVEVRKKTFTGIIGSSLSVALAESNFPHQLALNLTELYAYTLDFHHLQKGDYFKVIYNEKYVDNKPVEFGKILAACFNHRGQDLYAFYFGKEYGGRYYDQNGNSLERYFLKSPLKYATITSHYSKKRLHPILNHHKPHLGVDYAAPSGTPIMSVGDGIVRKAAYHKENGNYVTIRHNGIYTTQYLHMSKIAKGIDPGVSVKRGEVIGYVGSTGIATGPHVEYRLWKNGKPIDPLKEKMPTSKPVKKEDIELFENRIAEFKRSLENLELSAQDLKKILAKN